MQSVMISIKPKWCKLIANGKKTIEVRRTRPKLEMPFKCYIYCTKGIELWGDGSGETWKGIDKDEDLQQVFELNPTLTQYNSKVIGEFICDTFVTDKTFGHDALFNGAACMSVSEAANYSANKEIYGWHISDLKIYEKPKELSEFILPSYGHGCVNEGKCRECKFFDSGNGYNVEDDCNAHFCTDDYKPMRRPPQSWCYVEELCI